MASSSHEQQQFNGRCTELLNAAAVSTALALASKTGLLEAMLADEQPRSSHEWGTQCRIHFKTSHDILQMLHAGQVTSFIQVFRMNANGIACRVGNIPLGMMCPFDDRQATLFSGCPCNQSYI